MVDKGIFSSLPFYWSFERFKAWEVCKRENRAATDMHDTDTNNHNLKKPTSSQTLQPSLWLEDSPLPERISWCQEGLEVLCDLGDHDHGAHDHDHGRQGEREGPGARINSGGSQCQQRYCIKANGCCHLPG